METIVASDADELSEKAADRVVEVIHQKPNASLVLAVGESPLGLYRALARRYAQQEFVTKHLRIFQLDAYWDIPPDDPRSLYKWLGREFLIPLEIPLGNIVRLEQAQADAAALCAAYERSVREVDGFDLSILGLGPNGHLGFNEPPSDDTSPTRCVELTEASIASNARYWGGRERVPRFALTCGMDLLLAARQTLLIVTGERKREILEKTLHGAVTPDVPASFLQRAGNVSVFADRLAFGKMRGESSND